MSPLRTKPRRPLLPVALLALALWPASVICQSPSSESVEAALAAIADQTEANYVFAEKGVRVAAEFRAVASSGAFSAVADWEEFAQRTTRSLRELSQDGHMYVRRDPEIVAELRAGPSGASAADESVSRARARAANYGIREVRLLDGGLAYLRLSEINFNEESLPLWWAAMQLLSNAAALVVDLRGNGGGGSTVGPVFESFFLPPGTPLLAFQRRGKPPQLRETLDRLPIPRNEKPLFIIVDAGTASAAEYLAFVMQLRGRAVIVGRRTAGAAHMNSWYPVNDELYLSVSTGAPTIPGTEKSWERSGVVPDHVAEAGSEMEFVVDNWRRLVATASAR